MGLGAPISQGVQIGGRADSRGKPRNAPRIRRFIFSILKTVVKSRWLPLPEFEHARNDSVTTPVFRPGDRLAFELKFQIPNRLLQFGFVIDRLRLRGRWHLIGWTLDEQQSRRQKLPPTSSRQAPRLELDGRRLARKNGGQLSVEVKSDDLFRIHNW